MVTGMLTVVLLVWVGPAHGQSLRIEGVDPPPPLQPAPTSHPLREVLDALASPPARRQPAWKRTLVWLALNTKPRHAQITAFCPHCAGQRTRWGSPVRPGIAAADPAYWGPGSVVWVGPPVSHILVVEDTGSAVRGLDRFDVCVSLDHGACVEIGQRSEVLYVELYHSKPRAKWGSKPANWRPPVPFKPFPLLPRVPGG
jgi:3D (Asp-Asp-Asp) domain-containing protein